MKAITAALFLLVIIASGCGNNGISDQDRQFMAAAGSAGIMEVTIGQIAADKCTRSDVISYGKEMVREHTSFNDEFHALLKKLGETVPGTMNSYDQGLVARVKGAGPDSLDNTYIEIVCQDHKDAVDQFKKAISIAKNPDYLVFLKRGLVIVTHHYEMAEALRNATLPKPKGQAVKP